MDREEGSATVLALGLLGVVSAVAAVLTAFASAFLALHQAQQGADFAALAAARAVYDPVAGGEPCAVAAEIAVANGAEVISCRMRGENIVIEAQATRSVFGQALTMQARSMAGPE